MEFKTNNANNNIWGNMFGVPCVVADNFLKMADGEHIKVLLYILRHPGKDCSEEEISANTGVEIKTVTDAVKFWQQANVITPQQTSPPALFDMTPPVVQPAVTENVTENPVIQQQKIKPDIPKRKNYTGREILHLKQTSPDIKTLLDIVQDTLVKVNNEQIVDIINMHETLGMKKEVIMVLVNHCKASDEVHCMYRKAEQWFADNINTMELAMELIDYIQQVGQMLQINSAFSEYEQQIIGDWFRWNITIDMIKEAYEIAKFKDKLSIGYMNGIIKNWREKGISTLQAIQEDNKKNNSIKYNKNKKSKKKNSDFDVDMYNVFINSYEVI